MPISKYMKQLRERVGPALVLVAGTGAVIPDDAGRVLLLRRSDSGLWGLPGGAIDPSEAPAQALVREVREETGLRVRPLRVAGVFGGPRCRYRYPNGDEVETTSILFECAIVDGNLESRDGEALEFAYFAPDALPELAIRLPAELVPSLNGAAEPAFEWNERWLDELE